MSERATPTARRPEPLSILWRVLAAPQTLMALSGLLILALAAAILIPQLPLSARGDAAAWLALQDGLSGSFGGVLRSLGLYDIFDTLGFRLVMVAIALVLLVRAVEATSTAWHAVGRGRWRASSFSSWSPGEPARDLPSSLPLAEARNRVDRALKSYGYRVQEVADAPVPALIAVRRPALLWALPVAYGALLVAWAGLAVLGTLGWRDVDWTPAAGQSQPVGHGTPYLLRLDAFDPAATGFGSAQVAWLEGDGVLSQGRAAMGSPATWTGISARLTGLVPDLTVRGSDAQGNPLVLQEEGQGVGLPTQVEVLFSSPQAQPLVYLPQQDLFLVFSFEPPGTATTPTVRLDLVRTEGGERLASQTIGSGQTVDLGGLHFVVGLSLRPILRVDYLPGVSLIIAGLLVALVAVVAGLWKPQRLVWIALGPGEQGTTRVHVAAPTGLLGFAWLPDLARLLEEFLKYGA